MTLSASSNPKVIQCDEQRHIDRLIRERTSPGGTDTVPVPLPVSMGWEPGQDLYRFARRLAACNGYTIAQIMGEGGRSLVSCQYVGRELGERLSVLTGEPIEVFIQEPRQYRQAVQRHALTGWLEPESTDPSLWVERLSDTPDGRRIRDDVRTTSWPEVRLDLLARLARAFIPHLSASWPAHPSFQSGDRCAVIADDTRSGPIEQWSPQVRRYALMVLWDHTDVGVTSQTVYRCRTPVARDLLMVQGWREAASAARDAGLRSVGEALVAAGAQWPPAERPATPTGDGHLPAAVRIRAGNGPVPGPFSIRALRTWPPVLTYTVHVADIALDAWRSNGQAATAWTLRALQRASDRLTTPFEPALFDRSYPFREAEPPGFASAACRLLANEAGRQVLLDIADLADTDSTVGAETVRPWWPTLLRRAIGDRHQWVSLRGVDPDTLANLLWVDLTGHLPATLFYEPSAEDPLFRAARVVAPEDVLRMRDWATQTMAGADLPVTERRRSRPVREANM